MKFRAILFLILFSVGACSQAGVEVTEEEYGEEWPFTVSSGVLECRHYLEVVISADGNTYALNGTAMGKRDYKELEEIWAENPEYPGSKKSVSDVIRRGLDLCES